MVFSLKWKQSEHVPFGIIFLQSLTAASFSSCWNIINDFGNIQMNFGNEFWLILFREYISSKLFAVHSTQQVKCQTRLVVRPTQIGEKFDMFYKKHFLEYSKENTSHLMVGPLTPLLLFQLKYMSIDVTGKRTPVENEQAFYSPLKMKQFSDLKMENSA